MPCALEVPLSPEAFSPATSDAADSQRIAGLSIKYGDALRRYFARRLPRGVDGEDLSQEVFIRLLRRGNLGDIENIEGYLFQTAANLLRERGRHRYATVSMRKRPSTMISMRPMMNCHPSVFFWAVNPLHIWSRLCRNCRNVCAQCSFSIVSKT